MAKARPRYIAKDNIRFNDVVLHGQVVMLVGECDLKGETKNSKNKPLKKKEKTHYKLKFEDKKWVKQHKLDKAFSTFTHSKHGFENFFILQDDKSTKLTY